VTPVIATIHFVFSHEVFGSDFIQKEEKKQQKVSPNAKSEGFGNTFARLG